MLSDPLPIIEFRNSWIYNQQWTRPDHLKEPPSALDWQQRQEKLQRLWDNHGRDILKTMSSTTGLNWEEDRIIVYLTWGVKPFSDPLTLSLRADVDSVFDTLVHELTHRLVSSPGNHRTIWPAWEAFVAPYKQEDPLAYNHVPIHAVHEMVWQKLFPARADLIKKDLKLPAYVRAWEIVGTIGAENIVDQIFKQ